MADCYCLQKFSDCPKNIFTELRGLLFPPARTPKDRIYPATWKSGPCWMSRPSWNQVTSGSGCPDTTTSNTACPPSGTSSPLMGFINRGGSMCLDNSRPCCVDDAETESKVENTVKFTAVHRGTLPAQIEPIYVKDNKNLGETGRRNGDVLPENDKWRQMVYSATLNLKKFWCILGVNLRLGPCMCFIYPLFLLNLSQNARRKAAINRHMFSSLLLHHLQELLSCHVHHLESL